MHNWEVGVRLSDFYPAVAGSGQSAPTPLKILLLAPSSPCLKEHGRQHIAPGTCFAFIPIPLAEESPTSDLKDDSGKKQGGALSISLKNASFGAP